MEDITLDLSATENIVGMIQKKEKKIKCSNKFEKHQIKQSLLTLEIFRAFDMQM